jgi:hypothetical protein
MPFPLTSSCRAGRLVLLTVAVGLWAGCTSPLFRGQSPEPDEIENLVELSDRPESVRLVGDLAVPWGLTSQKIEGVGLVTQLQGTGSDPTPSPLRDKLIKEMQTHDVKNYTKTLASPDTAMAVVRGYIPPGAQKGDVFDIEVRNPFRSKTTSFRQGWLMQTRLRPIQMLDTVREGHVMGLAAGEILVDALFEGSDDPVAETRGRIPGGGVVRMSRQLGLAISDEHSSVRTSQMIGAAINERFHHFDHGTKKGVANPKRDNMLELVVHPRYRHNLGRYIRVIRSIAVNESPRDRSARLVTLGRMLQEPTTAEVAALQLEAIGEESAAVLREGLQVTDPEVQFYAAEALAYLDDSAAVKPLAAAVAHERAFRWRGLTALAAMDSYEATEALAELMNLASAETRYGAFRALHIRNPRDQLVRGEVLNNEFSLHIIPGTQEPLLHFSRTRRPELVVFGSSVRLRPPDFLYAGDSILIRRLDDQSVRMSCFRPGQDDTYEVCSTEIGDVIRTIVKLGGTYANVFEAMRGAKEQGALAARVEVDAIPTANRQYERYGQESDGDSQARFRVTNPIPGSRDEPESGEGEYIDDIDAEDDQRTDRGWFDRMSDWFTGNR